MKKIKVALVALLVALCALPSAAGIRFGVKLGLDVNTLHFNNKLFDSDNRAGFTGGLMAEFTVPVIGVGCDLSVMYVRRNARFMDENIVPPNGELGSTVEQKLSNNRDYIEIPLNFKYKVNIPVINNIIRPFITTGPSVAFLTSRKAVNEFVKNKSCDFAWNFGLGLELFTKVQVAASYGLGLTKAVESAGLIESREINGKNRYWTVTAAYLF